MRRRLITIKSEFSPQVSPGILQQPVQPLRQSGGEFREVAHSPRCLDQQSNHPTRVIETDELLGNPAAWMAIVVVAERDADRGSLIAELLVGGGFARATE